MSIPPAASATMTSRAAGGMSALVPADGLEAAAVEGGLTQAQAAATASNYGEAQLGAPRLSLGRSRSRPCSRVGREEPR